MINPQQEEQISQRIAQLIVERDQRDALIAELEREKIALELAVKVKDEALEAIASRVKHLSSVSIIDDLHTEIDMRSMLAQQALSTTPSMTLDAVVEVLKRLEWDVHDETMPKYICPICFNFKEFGHSPNCKLSALLQKLTAGQEKG